MSISAAREGGYAFTGVITRPKLGQDLWVARIDESGNLIWQKFYDEASIGYCIRQTDDGGFIVAGVTPEFGAGGDDVYVLKIDGGGSPEWSAAYGGTDTDMAFSIEQTLDGGYVLSGFTNSFGAGEYDALILKISSSGVLEWQRTYGGFTDDRASQILPTSDGGYILAGRTASFGAGEADALLVKLDSRGDVLWESAYGDTGTDRAYSVCETKDGHFLITGFTSSFGAGEVDAWVVKVTSLGDIVWQRAYGTTGRDAGDEIIEVDDGSYVFAGESTEDALLVKLGADGAIIWQRSYDVSAQDEATSFTVRPDGGYALAGFVLDEPTGFHDALTISVNPAGKVPACDLMQSPRLRTTVTTARRTITELKRGIPDILMDRGSPVDADASAAATTHCYSY